MKRILKALTSRLFLTSVSLLIQFAIIFVLIAYFNSIFVYYYAFSLVLSLILCVHAINKNTNSGYKIAWLLLILVLPIFGATVYLMLETRFLSKKKKMLEITYRIKDAFDNKSAPRVNDAHVGQQINYISEFAYTPPVKNTKSKYFSGGEVFLESLLSDLKAAEKSIYLEYFIIKRGYMWDEISRILVEKAKMGVDVRIIYDDIGSIGQIGARDFREIKEAGGRVKVFNRFKPIISSIQNNRDHRKICVIDTKIAYSGGINVGDEYINLKERFGYFKDSGIRLEGEGAYHFWVFFLTLWEFLTNERAELKKPSYEKIDEGICQPYTDSPIDREHVGENVYMNLISKAREYVYISTPYFVVDDEMLKIITNTAKRGVDVRIILPHVPDKRLVNQITKSYYLRLIDAGVKVYEYKKGFNHSKIVIADGEIATVGSVNFDYRSFYLSFECGVLLYNSSTINDILNDYNNMLSESVKITSEMASASLLTRLARAVLAAFSPLL